MNAAAYIKEREARFNRVFPTFLFGSDGAPDDLIEAMRYSMKVGGKRMRPLLVYATGELLGAELEALDRAACCVEFIHTYSLIHDDLPAMDNADFRRNQPACHKVFGEATAILAGNALQNLAYVLILEDTDKPCQLRLDMMRALSNSVGLEGVLGGQMLDLKAHDKPTDLIQIEKIHYMKTAALISASVKLGALASGTTQLKQLDVLERLALDFGLAFQIGDDIQDREEGDNVNYANKVSLESAYVRLEELYQSVFDRLEQHYSGKESNPLLWIMGYIKELLYEGK